MSPVVRPSLREEHKRLTRRRILDGTVALLAERPFVEVTMEDVARSAGVTRVTVYAHFPGKTEILRALVDDVHRTADDVYAELAALPVWSRGSLRSWLDGVAARWETIAPVVRALIGAGPVAADARDRSRAARQRHVALLADDPRRWPGTPPPEARQRALMAVLQLESFLSVWLAGGWPVETDSPLDLLADALCHLLAPTLDP